MRSVPLHPGAWVAQNGAGRSWGMGRWEHWGWGWPGGPVKGWHEDSAQVNPPAALAACHRVQRLVLIAERNLWRGLC